MATEFIDSFDKVPTVQALTTPYEKSWWRKVIWRSVLIYALSLLTATTLALGFHEPWYVMPLWYALFLPLACAMSRSYL